VEALARQKPALEAAATALFVSKKAAYELYRKKVPIFNADDLVDKIPFAIERLLK